MTFYLQLSHYSKAGLCNQLYSLAGCIDYGVTTGSYNTIYISNFCLDIDTGGFYNISDVLDLVHFNKWAISQNYNIALRDGDKIFGNYQKSPIIFFGGSMNKDIFIGVLKYGIKFNRVLRSKIEIPILNEKNVTIIHLRTEPDVVEHYKNQLELSDMQLKYIDLIKMSCDPQRDFIFILTGKDEGNNSVIYQYLNDNGYGYYVSTNKFFTKRELNAIADMVIAEELTKQGKVSKVLGLYESSYSYTLIHKCFSASSNIEANVCAYLHNGIKYINSSTTCDEYQKFL
jgi:hypothetical protein